MKRPSQCICSVLLAVAFLILIESSSLALISPGERIMAFKLTDVTGAEISARYLAETPFSVLYFFVLDSKASRDGLVSLKRLVRLYPAKKIRVLALSRDDPTALLEFKQNLNLPFPLAYDRGDVAKRFGVGTIYPVAVLLGPAGVVLKYLEGGGPSTQRRLFNFARRVLGPYEIEAIQLVGKDMDAFMAGSTPEEIEYALELCRRYQKTCLRKWYETETYRETKLSPFEIDKYEVTNRQFATFVRLTNYQTDAETMGYSMHWDGRVSAKAKGYSWRAPDGPGSSYLTRLDNPVAYISYNDAAAYCKWARGRLPTEDQWEYAARGRERRIFPWGNEWAPDRALWHESATDGTQPVGSFPRGTTPEGIHDMSGSMWEWTSTKAGRQAVLKGGSWIETNPANLRAAVRRVEEPTVSHEDDGFRCVRDLDQLSGR